MIEKVLHSPASQEAGFSGSTHTLRTQTLERTAKLMATTLDRQIEQLEKIVEAHLDFCNATWNGIRCTLPANHKQTEPHNFPIDFKRG
jgi:hypothetical protein